MTVFADGSAVTLNRKNLVATLVNGKISVRTLPSRRYGSVEITNMRVRRDVVKELLGQTDSDFIPRHKALYGVDAVVDYVDNNRVYG